MQQHKTVITIIIFSFTILSITPFSRSSAAVAAAFSKSIATSTSFSSLSFYSTRRSIITKMSTSSNVNTNLKNPHKRMKTSASSSSSFPISTKTIATHNGTFQADEALGVWLLRQTSEYYQSKVIRTRDESVYSKADIVIDVGGVYDHQMKKYDHHQRDYDERFDEKVELVVESATSTSNLVEKKIPRITKLSASGLVYRHYGKEVIQNIYPTLSNKDLDLVYTKMYNSFMEAIDAIDTGVEPLPKGCAIELQYRDSTGLSSRVSRLNPRWNDDDDINPDDRFEDASALCGDDFMSVLTSIVESTLPARTFVEQAVVNRFNIDPSGQIIKFESGGLPWKSHLYDLEKEHNLVQYKDLIKFVLYTDQSNMWRIQAVTVEGQAFENRLSLPEHWRGVRDADLEKIAGIEGCTFCHAAGFIGGNKSFEGVLQMARVALQQVDEEMK
jgi:uncharacterized UPF0160 family protein